MTYLRQWHFTTLDLAHAYNQIELEEESKQLLTINTHKRLYRYHHLPFGVSAAPSIPSIFQRTMENLLQEIPGDVQTIFWSWGNQERA